jgi:hypothetical protein
MIDAPVIGPLSELITEFFARLCLVSARYSSPGDNRRKVAGSGAAALPLASTEISSSEKKPVSFLKLKVKELVAVEAVPANVYCVKFDAGSGVWATSVAPANAAEKEFT